MRISDWSSDVCSSDLRTTRSVKLTDSGRRYYEECRQALAQLVEAQREVMGQQQVPSGTLRISIPTTYAHHRVLPMLPAFRERFPQIGRASGRERVCQYV